jgi:hypothetical protein
LTVSKLKLPARPSDIGCGVGWRCRRSDSAGSRRRLRTGAAGRDLAQDAGQRAGRLDVDARSPKRGTVKAWLLTPLAIVRPAGLDPVGEPVDRQVGAAAVLEAQREPQALLEQRRVEQRDVGEMDLDALLADADAAGQRERRQHGRQRGASPRQLRSRRWQRGGHRGAAASCWSLNSLAEVLNSSIAALAAST